ncbi:type IV toxin-antitoxin system AbiEi family antitoxin domain-containing protein [Micromonospora sp. NPDC003197]
MDADVLLRRIAAGQDGVITADQACRAGMTRDQIRQMCRSGRWRRMAWGIYLIDPEVGTDVLRRARIRAAVASLGPGAVAVLDTAAELYGIAGLRRSPVVHVSVPVDRPRPPRHDDPEVVVHQLTTAPDELGRAAGIPATTPARTLADLILRVDRYPAVCLLDSALNQELVPASGCLLIERLIRGRRGAVAARRHLAEADCRAQSPLETWVRLRCNDGRVPPDALQVEVRDDDGYLLGVGDLGWRLPRIIGEADGRGPHGTPDALHEDRRRQNRLVNAGWAILRFTWEDTMRPDYIPHVVRTAIAARLPR